MPNQSGEYLVAHDLVISAVAVTLSAAALIATGNIPVALLAFLLMEATGVTLMRTDATRRVILATARTITKEH